MDILKDPQRYDVNYREGELVSDPTGCVVDDEGHDAMVQRVLSAFSNKALAKELCRRLAAGIVLGDYHEQTDPDKQGIPGELDTIGEAKEIARELLHAAKVDGLGGCCLCKS